MTTQQSDYSSYKNMVQTNIWRLLPSFNAMQLKETDTEHVPFVAFRKIYSEWLRVRKVGMRYRATSNLSNTLVFSQKVCWK